MKRSILVGCLLVAGIGALPGKALALDTNSFIMKHPWNFSIGPVHVTNHTWAEFYNDDDPNNGDYAGRTETYGQTAQTECLNPVFGPNSWENWGCWQYNSNTDTYSSYTDWSYNYWTVGNGSQNFHNWRAYAGGWGWNETCHENANRAQYDGIGAGLPWVSQMLPGDGTATQVLFCHCGSNMPGGLCQQCPDNRGGMVCVDWPCGG